MAAPSDSGRPPLRRDAELNRRRIIAAAREVFRERGLSATLDDVARHAGVGVGTAYRRFPNKEALVEAVFEDMFARVEESTKAAAEDPDPWRGLTTNLEQVAELQAFDRGMREILLGTGRPPRRPRDEFRQQVKHYAELLVERAQAQGVLRADARAWDLPMIQLMLGAITDSTGEPDLWRRYLRLMLDGLRVHPDGAEPLPGGDFADRMAPPLGPSQRPRGRRGAGLRPWVGPPPADEEGERSDRPDRPEGPEQSDGTPDGKP
jgi:AcrR family transcriptional regulator